MIVGNGVLASAFAAEVNDWNDFIIFASGVSNSKESRMDAYERESELINSFLGTQKTLVYFSTTSIFDDSKQNDPYVQFKKDTESYIKNNFKNHLIVRLPIVVSKNNNTHQLIGHIKAQITSGEKLIIHKYAARYFVDVRDIPRYIRLIFDEMKKAKIKTLTLNVGYPHKISMMKLVDILKELYPDLSIELAELGYSYETDFSYFQSLITNEQFHSSDPENILRYYLKEH